MSITVAVDDLFFLARIRETARQAGVAIEIVAPVELPDRLARGGVTSVILDLSAPPAIELVRTLKVYHRGRAIPIVGFVSHVAGDIVAAARAAGCDRVLARSAFTKQLADLLRELAQSDAGASDQARE